ncbi:hypothetical protein Tco_0280783 [Tanacetum coccineum]
MKEILHDQMFESVSYKSQPEHGALYEALEASMERDNMDEFLAKKDKSRKRRRDDQDPPPPPIKESKQSKKKKRDSDASVDGIPILDVDHISDSEDTGVAHLLKIKNSPEWLKRVLEEDRTETPEPDWIGKSKLYKVDLEGPAYKVVRAFHSNNISLHFQMEECHLMLTDQIDLVNPEGHRVVPDVSKPLPLEGSKERRSALSISKLKAANYPDFGLEELVPSLLIESECEYNISIAYGISHWWFKRKEFDITRYSAHSDRRAVRSHMKILNVDAIDFLIKEDYTIISKPRFVSYRDKNNQNKMMWETEVHKFSDGTLTRILEKLDHMVKDFKLFKYNPSMEKRIWSQDDRLRIKEFMEEIERRLKIRRIFRSLESFVSGRLRDVDYKLIQRTE